MPQKKDSKNQKIQKLLDLWRSSPETFIEDIWGLTPQPIRKQYEANVLKKISAGEFSEIKARHFGRFVKGEHITWQQWLILKAVERAMAGEAPPRISVGSGHGIGKTTTFSWLNLWFLFCFKNSQIPCTAPTSEQIHDVLWKEISIWIQKMPEDVSEKFEWTTGYVRMKENPEAWFARARTARKENPEALAGMHGAYVMYEIDEASGVDDAIFRTAEGALTGSDILVLMISNCTRLIGYFYDSHHSDKKNWQVLSFSSEDSPIVDDRFVARMREKHGEDSDEYRVRVLGQFPREDAVDDKGYVPLLVEKDLRRATSDEFVGTKIMGVDPSGEGSDKTTWVVRDAFRAKVVGREHTSSPKTIAEKTLTLMDYYDVWPENVWIDNFGVGANVAQEMALSIDQTRVQAVNVGVGADDAERFINKRAEAFFALQVWLRSGGELVWDDGFRQLLTIRYKRTHSGKFQIMSKDDMRKLGLDSPDYADAFMLTFYNVKREAGPHVAKQYKPSFNKQAKQFKPLFK